MLRFFKCVANPAFKTGAQLTGNLLWYLLGAVVLGGMVMQAIESAGALPVALFLGWLAWLQFGNNKPNP